tara:strand:- start:1704 stop:2336 length:633 start_codon:yes stop_codon:yes gene_type:complete
MKEKSKGNLQKRFILLEFTKELIRHSSGGEVYELKNILEKKSLKKERNLTSLDKEYKPSLKGKGSFKEKIPIPKPRYFAPRRGQLPPLIVPKQQLPPRLQYLKPSQNTIEIDLDKLNPLMKDPLVKEIECFGAMKNIVVSGAMGRKKTDVKLSREEIEEVIKKFSEATKIPISEGVYKVVAGKLVFSAVISNIVSSKFTIKKMVYNPGFR